MEFLKKEVGLGILMGIVGVFLLGVIIKIFVMFVSVVLKFGGVIFDIGVVGLVWVFFDEVIESFEFDIYWVILVIVVVIFVVFVW